MARVPVFPKQTGVKILHPHRDDVQNKQPFVNLDAHIPYPVRVPQTWSLVESEIRKVSPALTRRPSDFYVGGSRTWVCPKLDCVYTIMSDDLTQTQRLMVERATEGIDVPFTLLDGDHCSAAAVYVREVIDIIALAHYESAHFQPLRIRHILHGQRNNGRVRT